MHALAGQLLLAAQALQAGGEAEGVLPLGDQGVAQVVGPPLVLQLLLAAFLEEGLLLFELGADALLFLDPVLPLAGAGPRAPMTTRLICSRFSSASSSLNSRATAACRSRGLSLLLDLVDDVAQPDHVLLDGLQLAHGLVLAAPVLEQAGRFLDEGAALLRAAGDDPLQAVLADDRGELAAHPEVGQQFLDVDEARGGAVEQVLALAGAEELAGDHYLLVVEGDGAAGVVEGEGDLGHAQRAALVAAREDDVLHLAAAQVARALLPHHPQEGLGDVALAGAVGPDDDADARLELQGGAVGEGLEALHLQRFQVHTIPGLSSRETVILLASLFTAARQKSCLRIKQDRRYQASTTKQGKGGGR